MIFTKENIELIKAGKKTQTRRVKHLSREWGNLLAGTLDVYKSVIIKPNDDAEARVKWAVGHDYALQPGRGQKSIGRIRITSIRQESLQHITDADAIAEGVTSIEAYRALWRSIHGKTKGAKWTDNPLVWVLGLEYVGDAP